jgi:hypothetical protein
MASREGVTAMAVKFHKSIVQVDGKPMLVLRPKDPRLALSLAEIAVQKQSQQLLDELPEIVSNASGDYTFMGYLAKDRKQIWIADENGKRLGDVVAGDSFVTDAEPAS